MSRGKTIIVALAAAVAVVFTPLWAWACTVILQPSFQLDEVVVPSTVAGTLFGTCGDEFEEEDPEFFLFDDESDEEIALSFERHVYGVYEITFEEELDSHRVYRFEARIEDCPPMDGEADDPHIWYFQTAGAEQLPQDIGIWEANDPAQGLVQVGQGAGCSFEAEAAFVDLFFNPGDDGEKWGQALAFETYVQEEFWAPKLYIGQSFVGHSRLGWGEERVYSVCEHEAEKPNSRPYAAALEQGINYIQIVAWLPGTDLTWATDNELFVLRCDEEEEEQEEEQEGEDDEDDDAEDGDEDEDDEGGTCSATGSGNPLGPGLVVAMLVLMSIRTNRWISSGSGRRPRKAQGYGMPTTDATRAHRGGRATKKSTLSRDGTKGTRRRSTRRRGRE